jgi:ribosomal protein L29
MSDMQKKTDAELVELTQKARETIRSERFKDKFSRKASVIQGAKKEVARALTVLSKRRGNTDVK